MGVKVGVNSEERVVPAQSPEKNSGTAPDTNWLKAHILITREVNHLLLEVREESELFKRICELLAGLEFIRFAWIGLAEKETFGVTPIAHSGFENGYLRSVKVTWDDSQTDPGPTGAAIRTGEPVVVRDICCDPQHTPWREEAVRRGYASSAAVPLVHEGEVVGILNVYSHLPDAFDPEEMAFLAEIAGDIALGIKRLRLERKLDETVVRLRQMLYGTVEALSRMLELRDPYTAGHQMRVARLACAIAREMGWPEDRVEGLRLAALLHDIGKMAIPAEILTAPRRLTEPEMQLIRLHPVLGFEVLKGIEFPWPVSQALLQHHERMDGSGYPGGLRGEAIIPEARILGVADVVESMASHRPYRAALGMEAALEEISRNSGILYDPQVVKACLVVCRNNPGVLVQD
ncbi:metal dependent phosphohydrolase with GAF sensor [Desulfofundulus kuznetsovii DSM 6115]|uniref:Metal dependent phosphohydrolase with GAF sensor n=2 Tax=Desulfofundulus kuznetsovii TaxID=58135 RepID=A0AAU8P9E0_DESK7|nr:metal dependent phosphohydrolase with GAF sensor [Desulfofundulus kuznetsovii DSM 6115]